MHEKRPLLWIVDDESTLRHYLSAYLEKRGYDAVTMESGEIALSRINTPPTPSLLLLDLRMPGVGGLQVLTELEKAGVRIPSIVMSGIGQIRTVVEAMRCGAQDYLVKPIDEKDLEIAVARALADGGASKGAGSIEERIFQSSNPRMLQIRKTCDVVAETDLPVLILGESGVGKELIARYIHARSRRRGPFVKVNCAALPSELQESELFGHERGAFTGALKDKPGKFQIASQGTIMLDEVGEMTPLQQAKLLHVLQDGEYSRVGGTQTLTSDARVIAATNKPLESMVTDGRFREDLYFRLNVLTIEIPPLRDRREDISWLAKYFLEHYRSKYKSHVQDLPPAVLSAYAEFDWPGNVRQLENSVKRYLILRDISLPTGDRKTVGLAADSRVTEYEPVSLKTLAAHAAETAERDLVFRTLREVHWNRKQAARRLGICYKSLLNKLHRWQAEQNSKPEQKAAAIAGSE